jgi:hypothetical protein
MSRTAYGRAILLGAALLLVAGCHGTREGKTARNSLATPEETVKAFCDLDAEATRLSSETWSRVRPYIAWEEEAGWDRTIVISGFTVSKAKMRSATAASVAVEYQVAGVLSGEYLRSRRTEAITFTLRKSPEGWKITSPDFMPPHVLMKPLIRHLEETKSLELTGKLKDAPKD